MKQTVILIIIPEIKCEADVKRWDDTVNSLSLKFSDPKKINDTLDGIYERWVLGYLVWKNLVDCFQLKNIKVFFVRTDYRLKELYVIEDNIIRVKFDNQFGHIIFKTIISYGIFEKQCDYIVRGNANTIIDIDILSQFVETLPKHGVFTSPFFEGGEYAFGYFFLISTDIARHVIDNGIDKRWLTEDTADDYEISRVILRLYNYYLIDGCDIPLKKTSKKNKHGIIFKDEGDSANMIVNVHNSGVDTFLYRVKHIKDKTYFSFYKQLFRHIWNKHVIKKFNIRIINEEGHNVPHLEYERDEQLLVARYVKSSDVVLELGARYGSVSCIINKILSNKLNQVSVEPDSTVWKALEHNMKINNCSFHIFKGIVSNKNYNLKLNGYGSTVDITNTLNNMTAIETVNITLEGLQSKFGLVFDTLVADCEGFLETFLNENKILYQQLRKIIFECDRGDVCDYKKVKSNLIENNFKMIEDGFQCVYMK